MAGTGLEDSPILRQYLIDRKLRCATSASAVFNIATPAQVSKRLRFRGPAEELQDVGDDLLQDDDDGLGSEAGGDPSIPIAINIVNKEVPEITSPGTAKGDFSNSLSKEYSDSRGRPLPGQSLDGSINPTLEGPTIVDHRCHNIASSSGLAAQRRAKV